MTDGNFIKPVVAALAHEDPQVVGGQHGIADDVVIERQIERDAGTRIVMEAESREQAVLRLIAGQAVELIVECSVIPYRQSPHIACGDQAPGTAARAGDMFHHRVTHTLHRDPVVPDFRAFAPQPPEFMLLVTAVSVDGKAAEEQVFDRGTGIIDRLPQNDHRAIGAVCQMQDSRFPGPAQGLMIPPQNNGLADFNHSRRQQHFPAAFRQGIQGSLDLSAGRAPV